MYITHNNLAYNLKSYLRCIKWLQFVQDTGTSISTSYMSILCTQIMLNLAFNHGDTGDCPFGLRRRHLTIVKALANLGLVKLNKRTVFDDVDFEYKGIRYTATATHIGNKCLRAMNIQQHQYYNINPPKQATFSDLSLCSKLIVCVGFFFMLLEGICSLLVIFLLLAKTSGSPVLKHVLVLAIAVAFLSTFPIVVCTAVPYDKENEKREMKYKNKIRKLNKNNSRMNESSFLNFLLKNHIIEMRLDYLNSNVIRVINNLMFS